MRYFLVSFCMTDRPSAGHACIESDGFFSMQQLIERVRSEYPQVDNLNITNIFEFANEEDYLSFQGKPVETDFDQWRDSIANYLFTEYEMPQMTYVKMLEKKGTTMRSLFDAGRTKRQVLKEIFNIDEE